MADSVQPEDSPTSVDPFAQKPESEYEGSGSEGGYPGGPETTEILPDAGAGS